MLTAGDLRRVASLWSDRVVLLLLQVPPTQPQFLGPERQPVPGARVWLLRAGRRYLCIGGMRLCSTPQRAGHGRRTACVSSRPCTQIGYGEQTTERESGVKSLFFPSHYCAHNTPCHLSGRAREFGQGLPKVDPTFLYVQELRFRMGLSRILDVSQMHFPKQCHPVVLEAVDRRNKGMQRQDKAEVVGVKATCLCIARHTRSLRSCP